MRQSTSLSLRDPSTLLATWFGAGLLPKAPGTWGSLAALPCGLLITLAFGRGGLLAATLVIFFVGWWAAGRYIAASGLDDPGAIVIDEVAGQWVVLLAAPPHLWTYLLGFCLFRLFDISKPWPVGWADRKIKGGLGVMADDILAGIYGAALLALASCLWGV